MSRIPEPDRSAGAPRYEGRPLARPDDEVVDQGLPFDVGTVMSRRRALSMLGLGAAVLGLAACQDTSAPAPGALAEIPEETAGPFPANGSNGIDVLEQTGIERSDIRSSIDGGATAAGVPMVLSLTLRDVADGSPLAGAAVYVWQCDAAGGYSMYSDGLEQVTYLRGVQVADAEGVVSFTSIVPGCYPGRWPHVHLEVYPDIGSITDAAQAIVTSQVALPQDLCERVYALSGYEGSTQALADVSLTTDMVFADDGGERQLATVTGDETTGCTATLTIGVTR